MNKKRLINVGCLFLCLAVLPASIAAQKKKPRVKPITANVTVPASNPTPAQRRQEAFMMAWATLNQNYFDKTFGGLDWNVIRLEYQPRVNKARTDAEFHRILNDMIKRLGKSHLEIIVPEYFESLEKAKVKARVREKQLAAERRAQAGKGIDQQTPDADEDFKSLEGERYGIGVEVKMLDGKMVISGIAKQSGAALSGLKPGYVIDKINGISLEDTIAQALISGTSLTEVRHILPIQIVESFLNGDADTSVFLTCIDESDKPKEFTVPRLKLDGETVSISNNFPEQFLRFESSSLNADVGYIKFNAFALPVIGKFCDSLTEFRNKKAVIIDLRGNLGGLLASMVGLVGMLTDKELNLGTIISRGSSQPFLVTPKNKHFTGKIVVLVDGQSMSASEMFTAGLQGSQRAIVVGERTGGQSLPAYWTRLSTGAVMVYPIADFITSTGKSLEGTGLEPDHPIALDRKSLLQGADTQLNKALALIADESAFVALGTKKISPTAAPLLLTSDAPPPMIKAIATPTPLPPPGPNDPRSLKMVADFITAIGGADAIKGISSYEMRGSIETDREGEGLIEFYAAAQFPDKYMMSTKSTAMGDIREIHNGKTSILQSDIGVDRALPPNPYAKNTHLLWAFFYATDLEYLNGLKYEGEYLAEGSLRRILSATSPEGWYVGLSFDDKSGLLKTFSLPGIMYTFGDYRKINNVMLPFQIDMDRVMKIKLSWLTVNSKLDASTFDKKVKCFDKAN